MTRTGVAVDVGNFAIKARFFCSEADRTVRCGEPVQVNLRSDPWRASLANWYESESRAFAIAGTDSVLWRVASVNPPPTRLLKKWVETRGGKRSDAETVTAERSAAEIPPDWQQVSFHDVPLKIGARRPEAVGIDRLIAAWAAWQGEPRGKQPSGATNWGITNPPTERRRAVIVVDAGSAMTVDLVDADGTFRGGAILPGRQMQLRSLGVGAFALPDLTHGCQTSRGTGIPSGGPECPGRDTEAAIQLGVLAGMVGAVRQLREAYRDPAGEAPELILTGGDAPSLAGCLGPRVSWVPNLVIDGLTWL